MKIIDWLLPAHPRHVPWLGIELWPPDLWVDIKPLRNTSRAPHSFDYYSFVVSCEIGTYKSYDFQDYFGHLGPLQFHMNLRIGFPIFVRKAVGILIRIALNLKITLDNIDIFNMGYVSVYLDVQFLLAMFCSLQYMSFTSLVKFMLRYFILDAIVCCYGYVCVFISLEYT